MDKVCVDGFNARPRVSITSILSVASATALAAVGSLPAQAQLVIPTALDAEAIFTDVLTSNATAIISAITVGVLMIVIASFGRHLRAAVRWVIG